ncbi:MAG: hypothetical protein WCF90_04035 [Methanomicrobiales archaeon]
MKPADYHRTLNDMLDPRYPWKSLIIAYPMIGTTATQAAALYSTLGKEKGHAFYLNLSERGVRGAIANGGHVALVVPDQCEGQMGTLVIPDTIALIASSPYPAEGKIFIDYLLDRNTKNDLVTSGWIQIPSRTVTARVPCLGGMVIKPMAVNYQDIYDRGRAKKTDLAEIFVC